jgi:hypothetical protein
MATRAAALLYSVISTKSQKPNYGLFADGFETREDAEQYILNYDSGNY